MNDTIQLLLNRKSVRDYEDRDIPEEIKKEILEAAIRAPSAGNMNPYSIIEVEDSDIKEKLAVSCSNQMFIAKAPWVVVFLADYRRWYELFRRNVSEDIRKPGIGDLRGAKGDARIVAQTAVIAAESYGIGSCYIGTVHKEYEYNRELLGLPDYVEIADLVCFGYPTKKQKQLPQRGRFKASDIVYRDRYDLSKSDAMERMLLERDARETAGRGPQEYFQFKCEQKWTAQFLKDMAESSSRENAHWEH